jgi:hypothetical protein
VSDWSERKRNVKPLKPLKDSIELRTQRGSHTFIPGDNREWNEIPMYILVTDDVPKKENVLFGGQPFVSFVELIV